MIAMLVLVARQWRRYLFARTDASFLPCAPLLLLLSSALRPLTKRSDSGSSCPPSSQAMLQQPPKSAIVGFHQDELGDWVAELQCGHNQHVRHRPPWCERPWVLAGKGRRTFWGHELSCPQSAGATRQATIHKMHEVKNVEKRHSFNGSALCSFRRDRGIGSTISKCVCR
jgi:Protein of unknown function (DUF3565)